MVYVSYVVCLINLTVTVAVNAPATTITIYVTKSSTSHNQLTMSPEKRPRNAGTADAIR